MANMYKLKLVLTGGGSGGHVVPALALLPDLNKSFEEIIYVGGNGIEKKLAQDAGLRYHEIYTVGFNRRKLYKNVKIPFALCSAVRDLTRFFRAVRPDVIFGKGGYVELPTVIAARRLHIPVVCHESDLSLGLANKIAHKLGATILTGFDKTATLSHDFICTGFPLRKKLFTGDKEKIIKNYGLDKSKKTVLFVGGSLGASSVNKVIAEALPILTKQYNVLHVTGKGKNDVSKISGYHAVEYTDDIQDFYAAADVVVSRAGAGALSEISILHKPAIFIPLPKTASRGDQLQNAALAEEYGARIILQENLTKETLIEAIYKSGKPMRQVAECGNRKIADILTAFAVSHKRR